jgi:hypothetical protein
MCVEGRKKKEEEEKCENLSIPVVVIRRAIVTV